MFTEDFNVIEEIEELQLSLYFTVRKRNNRMKTSSRRKVIQTPHTLLKEERVWSVLVHLSTPSLSLS